ncbi:MAG: cytochrome c [Chloroflexi bacterium]|nr:cytochrome c [Chloroflexota bacterium]MCC6893070.1 cytochrome c [Anaerolineae bacterium]
MSGTRLFFALCLVVSVVAFGAAILTSAPASAMPPAPGVGMGIWKAYNCEGCHTIYGQGGAYAPDLTHIYAARGRDYLREFLANPAAFHPDQRQMPMFGLTKSETDNLLAFLQWVGEQPAAQSWPPRPITVSGGGSLSAAPVTAPADNAAPVSDDPVVRGQALFSNTPAICSTCHSLTPDVVIVGPSLAGIAERAATHAEGQSAEAYIRTSIVNPSAHIVEGFQDVMQKNFGDVLTSDQINDLIAFLMTQ